MAFPQDPLGLLVEVQVDGEWEKLPVHTRDPITHQRGIRNEGSSADPASVPMTINNKGGKYSPRNPMSPYFGKIGRNTRVRLSLPGEETYLQLDGDPANYASTPDAAALDVPGDIDLRWEGETDWYATPRQRLISKWDDNTGSYALLLEDGNLHMYVTRDGLAGPFKFWPLPALPRRAALRGVLDADDGAGGWSIRLYWAPQITGPWTQLGTTTQGTTPVTIYNSTAPLLITPILSSGSPTGTPTRVYRAEVWSGSTLVAAPDFTAQPAGTTTFTDGPGRTWTLTGSAEIRDRVDRFIGEISEWPQKWVPSEADMWVPVQAAGILRRLGRGTKPLDSALRRRIPSYQPMAYWPMEEGQQATAAYSPIVGIDPLSFSQANWAADSSLPSSAPLPTVGSQSGNLSHLSGLIRNSSWASLPVWSVIWMYHMPQVPAARQTFMLIRSTGTVRDWYIQFGPDNSRILGLDNEGATVIDQVILTGTDIFGEWVKARFTVQQEGSNTRYRMVWQDIGGDAGNYSNTFAGVSGRPTGVSSPPGGYSANLQGLAIGHISAWDEADPAAYTNAMNAWSGERAGARMLRLAGEEGIPVTLTSPPADTDPIGYQKLSPMLELVRTAADADGGLLTEDQTALRLLYRPRSTLYSQKPALVLDYELGQIAAPLEPVDDDTDIRNDVTVTRDQGGSARVVLASGPLSVLDPPDGVGVYDDSITLSLAADEQTEGKAFWELHLGTWDEPRYPAVTINLHRHPELIPAVLALREGDVIRLTNMPTWVAPDDVDLMVMGLKETLLPRTWSITYDCVPAGPWRVGVTDDAVLGRVDTDGSQLAAAIDADDTTVSIAVTNGPLWMSNVREMPFDLRVGGEVMTVTSPGVLVNANGNPFFDTDIVGWSSENATLAWSDAVVHPDPHARGSLLITPAGGVDFAGAVDALSGAGSITAGTAYKVSAWVYSPGGASDVRPAIYWYTATGTFLSAAGSAHPAIPAGVWTYMEETLVAPATAAQARARIRHGNTPTPADVLYAWAVRITPTTAGTGPQTFTVVRSVNGVTKSHPTGQDVRLATPTRLAL